MSHFHTIFLFYVEKGIPQVSSKKTYKVSYCEHSFNDYAHRRIWKSIAYAAVLVVFPFPNYTTGEHALWALRDQYPQAHTSTEIGFGLSLYLSSFNAPRRSYQEKSLMAACAVNLLAMIIPGSKYFFRGNPGREGEVVPHDVII